MKTRFLPVLLLGILLQSVTGAAGLKLADPFGDAMVLQRDAALPIWGTATPGAEVTVEFAGQRKATLADKTGQWKLTLDALPASAQGRTFSASSLEETITLADVLVGEVWLCSGQSNMEWGILYNNSVYRGAEEVAAANFPQIRLRASAKVTASTPQTTFAGSPWKICSPENLRNIGRGGFSAVGYLFGKELHTALNVPVGLIQSAWGGTRIEPWTPAESFKKFPRLEKFAASPKPSKDGKLPRSNSGAPSNLYNAMIHPLVPYAICGAIWYQGESNLGQQDFAEKMQALVQGWRTAWNQGDFPFYYVQLAPFYYKKGNDQLLPLSWEQQTLALAIPNTGMAIINDIGNVRDIHPGDKHGVASRLARLALSRTYGKKFADDSGPIFKSARADIPRRTVIVEFHHTNSGLMSRDGKPLSHFEVAGQDGIYHPAKAVIVGSTVEATCEELTSPRHIRFAWKEDAEPNLMNGEKLPAGAFRSQK
ncbi:MAG: hypothetical protein LBD01_07305 [Puniceicoccales bacterium]|jgi:sialate O-acetylesterase|nr:hypothetical protein [Puniceicoccales bacterium]